MRQVMLAHPDTLGDLNSKLSLIERRSLIVTLQIQHWVVGLLEISGITLGILIPGGPIKTRSLLTSARSFWVHSIHS